MNAIFAIEKKSSALRYRSEALIRDYIFVHVLSADGQERRGELAAARAASWSIGRNR